MITDTLKPNTYWYHEKEFIPSKPGDRLFQSEWFHDFDLVETSAKPSGDQKNR